MSLLVALLFNAAASNSALVDANVVYSAPVSGIEMRMDVYRPSEPLATPTPAVLVFHGGAWMMGARTDVDAVAKALAAKGFVAATVSYRLAPRSFWPAMIDDAQTAVRFLRANAGRYRIDPDRLGAVGFSAGGHLSLLLGFTDTRMLNPKEHWGHSSKVQAVGDVFGPADLENDYGSRFDALAPLLFGKRRTEATQLIREASPILHVTPDDAPVFILHGEADPLVPVKQSRRLEEKLKSVGVPVESVYIKGMGHEIKMSDPAVRDAMQRLGEWLTERLGPPAQVN